MRRVMKAVPLVLGFTLIIAAPSVWANWVRDGAAICTATGNQVTPTIVSDGAGGAIVTWADCRSGKNHIYAQRLNASGAVQWTADGVAVCTATGNRYNPMSVSDGAGGAIITWEDWRTDGFDIYAQKVDSSGVVQWITDGVAICSAINSQMNPTIVSDGAGGAIITWQDWRSRNYDIYTQRVDSSGTVQWTAGGVALCMAPCDQSLPTLTSDGASGAIVAWYDNRTGYNWHIYAQKVDSSGAVQWTTDGVAVCAATGDEYSAPLTSDGAGGAIFACEDSRSGGWDLYAQKVNASGALEWTANGVAICTATGNQVSPTITSDGAGGAIVTWNDTRSGDYDVYAQGVNASGAVKWTTDGVALCTRAGNQWYPTIAPDGAGGAIVTWFDAGSGSYHVFAQRVDTAGAVKWTTDGVAVCTAAGNQEFPTSTSDGAGGAVVAWMDYRSPAGSWDIYGLRVNADGSAVIAGTDTPAVPIELRQNYPNPFNPATTVTYSIQKKCDVTLKIYDVSGKCIARLVDARQEKGSYAVHWNGKDGKGNPVGSGIYFYRLAAGSGTISRKMVLVR